MYQLKSNSIELWAIETDKEFKKSQLPMTEKQSNAFISCYMNQKAIDEDSELLEKLEKKQLGLSSVFWCRVKYYHTYTISPSLALFMSYILNSFWDSTIYANYLQYKAHEYNQKHIDLDFISTKCFPMGFPSQPVLQKVWDAQKVEGKDYMDPDNLHPSCQGSISFEKE